MMYKRYEEIEKQYAALYDEGKFKEGIELMEGCRKELSPEEYEKYYFKIMNDKAVFLRTIGDKEEFYNTVCSLVDNGYACGAWMFRMLPAEEDRRYGELKAKNDILMARLQEKAKLKYIVHLPRDYSGDKKYPVFFGLHGDAADGNIEDFEAGWKPDAAVNNGFIFVYVQSSQVYCHNGYAWCTDIAIGRKDMKECYENICRDYSVDKDCIIIGGFSGGAMAVMDFAMMDTLPIKGFIALCPGTILESFTRENSTKAARRGVKAVFIEGAESLEPSAQDVIKVFSEIELHHQYTIIEGLGHWYPKDLNERLDKAIKYIME